VPIIGTVADHLGLQVALALQVVVVVATIPIALLLPTEDFLRGLRETAPRAPAHQPVRDAETSPVS
jgi:hypothetical protein